MSNMTLSVILICKNEADKVRDCLESVKWADEIIVLDSGSQDTTCDIAREYTDQVYCTEDWPGFGPQKQRALDKARGQWVLSIDADERVSPPLKRRILKILQHSKFDAYAIKRPLVFFGKIIQHANGSNYHIRLFKRNKTHFSDDKVHESAHVNGRISTCREPLLHFSADSPEDNLNKLNQYTSLSAQKRFSANKKTSLSRAILGSLWLFAKVYLFQGGFLDGKAGFILATGFAHGSFYRHIKLMHLYHQAEQNR